MREKNKTACFVGIKPQTMPWRFNEKDNSCVLLNQELRGKIVDAIELGYTHFISGMELGADTNAAEIVLVLKIKYPHITLEAAIPCETQANSWAKKDRERYFNLLPKCDIVTYVSKRHTPTCLIERNKYMVDKSDLLIAVYNDTGGSANETIDYANRCSVDVLLVNF